MSFDLRAICGLCAAALLAAMALPGRAETREDAYGPGRAKLVPEEWTKANEVVSIRARILRDGTDKLAPRAKKGDTLRLDLSFSVEPGAKDRDTYLTSSFYFYDAGGEGSDYAIKDRPCDKGRLPDGLERFQPLVLDFVFRPRETDPRGTSPVMVSVRDTVLKDSVELAPTYNWQGGR